MWNAEKISVQFGTHASRPARAYLRLAAHEPPSRGNHNTSRVSDVRAPVSFEKEKISVQYGSHAPRPARAFLRLRSRHAEAMRATCENISCSEAKAQALKREKLARLCKKDGVHKIHILSRFQSRYARCKARIAMIRAASLILALSMAFSFIFDLTIKLQDASCSFGEQLRNLFQEKSNTHQASIVYTPVQVSLISNSLSYTYFIV